MNPDFTTSPITSVHQDPLRHEAKAQLDRIEASLHRIEDLIANLPSKQSLGAGIGQPIPKRKAPSVTD